MIELKHISYMVDNKKILDDINLKIDNGIFVITGPNGAGKSTLAKILMGIIKPTNGQIFYNGQDITNLEIDKRAKIGFSYAFQTPVKFKGLRVGDILKLSTADKFGVGNYLADVGLCAKEYLSREMGGELSGGELKRIEIATVLARNTQVSIFDEPEAGIDLWSFNKLVTTIQNFAKSGNKTLIIISHQQKMIEIASKIALFKNGKIEMLGEAKNIIPNLAIANCDGCGVR